MKINLSRKVRAGLYVATGIGSAVVIYLAAKSIIGDAEIALWASLSLFASTVAGFNLSEE